MTNVRPDYLDCDELNVQEPCTKTRGERRKKDYKKATRKKNIAEHNHGVTWYKSLHQYSKNKIHCTCPMCTEKTDMNSKNGTSHTDKKKLDSINSKLNEM